MTEANRLHFLDGIRGWGALAVLLYHVFINVFPVTDLSSMILSRLPFFQGRLAVWVFFIISGFSLSIHFCHNRDYPSLTRIALGRYFRLVIPILIVSFSIFCLYYLKLLADASHRYGFLPYALTSAPSLLMTMKFALYDVFFHYDGERTLIPPLWSMPYELFGSYLVLATLALIGGLSRRFVIYAVLMVLAYLTNPYYTTFVIGLIFAEIYSQVYSQEIFAKLKRRLVLLSKILLLPAIYFCTVFNADEPLNTYLLTATLITFCLIFNPQMTNILSGKLSRFLGKISFTLYLTHGPLFLLYTVNLYRIINPSYIGSWPIALLVDLSTVLVCIVAAWVLVPIDKLGIKVGKVMCALLLKSSNFKAKAQNSFQPLMNS